jgi:hypothetical protein
VTINDDGRVFVAVHNGMHLWIEPRQVELREVTTQRILVRLSADTSIDFRRSDGVVWGCGSSDSPWYLDLDELESIELWAMDHGMTRPTAKGQMVRVWNADEKQRR